MVGAVSALVLIYLSPTIQEDVLGRDSSLFPLGNPALVSMPLAFAVGVVVSLVTSDARARERFLEAERQIHLGAPPAPVPVEAAVAHPTGGRS